MSIEFEEYYLQKRLAGTDVVYCRANPTHVSIICPLMQACHTALNLIKIFIVRNARVKCYFVPMAVTAPDAGRYIHTDYER